MHRHSGGGDQLVEAESRGWSWHRRALSGSTATPRAVPTRPRPRVVVWVTQSPPCLVSMRRAVAPSGAVRCTAGAPPLLSRELVFCTIGRGSPPPLWRCTAPSCLVTNGLEFDRWGGHRRVWCPRRKYSFAPTALFGLEAINRGRARAFSFLSTLGTKCPCLGSAWEPFNSLVLVRMQSDK